METYNIIYYDDEFINKFERLKVMIEAEDRPALYRFLLDNFEFLFKAFQDYARQDDEGGVQAFEEADEEIRRELMRPLSYRQYRMIERAFSPWEEEEGLVIWSLWDFLHDNGRIYDKKVMSPAEVSGGSLILEEVYWCLARGEETNDLSGR